MQGVAQTNKIVEIVSIGRIPVTVIEVANTMRICKIIATPPVLTAKVSIKNSYLNHAVFSIPG